MPGASSTASPTPERLAEPLTFDNAFAADQDLEDTYWATMQKDLGIVLSDETRTDKYGSWHPLTLAPDAPVLDIDPSVVSAGLDPMWTAENLRSAWQVMAKFLVNEQLDSELAWDDTPENRQLLVNRVEGGAYDGNWYEEPQPFSHYLDTGTGPAVILGPLYIDQDYSGWREAGGQMLAEYHPAKPAPYSLDRPRTLVGSLTLDSVVQGNYPDVVEMTAKNRYCRPIRVESTKDRRYECYSWTVTDHLALVEGSPRIISPGSSWSAFGNGQQATVSDETRRRLPFLAPMKPDDGWLPEDVLGLTLRLPSSATLDADETCGGRFPENDSGQAFSLSVNSSGNAKCIRVVRWASAAKDKPVVEAIGTNQKLWDANAPGLRGTVAVSKNLAEGTTPPFDTVDFVLTDGAGPGYQITADVPSGTGEQFARQLLSTLDVSSASSPSPS